DSNLVRYTKYTKPCGLRPQLPTTPPAAWQPLSIYNDDVGSAHLPTGIDATDPFALFSLFFDAAQLEKLALHTNQHAEQVRAEDAAQGRPHARAWKPTSKTELYTYLAILMYMGVHREPTIEEYWGKLHKNAPTHSINNYIACTRWQQLNRYMYCTEAPQSFKSPFGRVWDLSKHLRSTSSTIWHASKHLCVDEAIIRFTRRASKTIIIKLKLTPKGFKI
ncbi:hypothetical protein BU23DRAFT_655894, partial [Bimuria novae-zelandiae CBS 107.79]